MNARASPRGLAAAVMCLVLLVAVNGVGWSLDPYVQVLTFDVTVIGGHESGLYRYEYTASIPSPGSSEDVYGWFLTGAYGIDLDSIGQTGDNGYSWYAGEIIQSGAGPSNDDTACGLVNPWSGPTIWWIQEDLDGVSGTQPGPIGTFSFDSTNPPMNREWLAHAKGSSSDAPPAYVTGWVEGPTPELSPLLLLLGQGVPMLGFIGWRRRQRS